MAQRHVAGHLQVCPLRPLGHVIFAAPRGPGMRWVIDAPGHEDNGQFVPEDLICEIKIQGNLKLPAGTFNVVQQCMVTGASGKWVLDAPGFKEDGCFVPEEFVGEIECDPEQGRLLLGVNHFNVVQKVVSSASPSLIRRRVSFNAEPEVLEVPPCLGGETWIFDTPGYKEHGRPVPADYINQITVTGMGPRICLSGGSYSVMELHGSDKATHSWILDVPGHPENGKPVPQKFVGSIVPDAKRGSLPLPGGTFNVVQRPRPGYKTSGPTLPLKRTMSEVVPRCSNVGTKAHLCRVPSVPCITAMRGG